uniref:Uncharacterized protein n=1 Tax=Ditylenchus dipsaci TaxID=166011 RepID=A0A915DMB1_9BILA
MTSPESSIEMAADRKLHIIEWNHLDLRKFYPMALASSWSVRCLLYPMSVVKARLQLQKQNNVYTGMRHAFVNIIKHEGAGALYRGFWVTLPQISASFVYSTTYEKVRNTLTCNTTISSVPMVSAMAGGLASCCTQLIFVPTDIVAQHMMIYNNPSAFTGTSKNAAIIDYLKADKLEKRLTLGCESLGLFAKWTEFSAFTGDLYHLVRFTLPAQWCFGELLQFADSFEKVTGNLFGQTG